MSAGADVVRGAEGRVPAGLGGDLVHPTLGLVVLLAIQVINVYKSQGMTPYGWRKQQKQRK
ncbi:MAG: hypothetical protein M3198_03005 [Actinomycetota bacterium]|nr:hypothetical protein [Actinomycetota bacterium]